MLPWHFFVCCVEHSVFISFTLWSDLPCMLNAYQIPVVIILLIMGVPYLLAFIRTVPTLVLLLQLYKLLAHWRHVNLWNLCFTNRDPSHLHAVVPWFQQNFQLLCPYRTLECEGWVDPCDCLYVSLRCVGCTISPICQCSVPCIAQIAQALATIMCLTVHL
jgi:hypothetical protein